MSKAFELLKEGFDKHTEEPAEEITEEREEDLLTIRAKLRWAYLKQGDRNE